VKWLTFKIQRGPGFRFNLIDASLLAALGAISLALKVCLEDSTAFWIPLYVGLTFFLFCNVFRIGNRLEPFWYLPFTLAAGYSIFTGDLPVLWLLVLYVLEPLKWALIAYRIIRGPYRGILSGRFRGSG